MTKRTQALSEAQERHRLKLLKNGRRKLPGTFIPEDCQETLEGMVEDSDDPKYGISSAIWECVRSFKNGRG